MVTAATLELADIRVSVVIVAEADTPVIVVQAVIVDIPVSVVTAATLELADIRVSVVIVA